MQSLPVRWFLGAAALLLLVQSREVTGFQSRLSSSSRIRRAIGTAAARQRPSASTSQLSMVLDPIMSTAATSLVSDLSTSMDAASTSMSSISHSLLMAAAADVMDASTSNDGNSTMLSNQTAITVFVIGLVPWTVATFEFWRRIAVGESFGTTSDAVVFSIGEDDNPASSRGRQVLGKGALVTAYCIFTVVAVVLGLVVYSVLTTPAMADV